MPASAASEASGDEHPSQLLILAPHESHGAPNTMLVAKPPILNTEAKAE